MTPMSARTTATAVTTIATRDETGPEVDCMPPIVDLAPSPATTGPVRGWIEWFAKGLWKRRRPIQVLIGITAAFTLLVLWQNRDIRPARTMNDPRFERAAGTLCTAKIRPLAEQRRTGGGDDPADTPKANAAKIERVAAKLEAAVEELRALPHAAANTSRIESWLAEFDAYIEAGRHYADALRTGDESVYTKADDEGVEPLKAISHFARANHIDACIP
jgi:hypothetical protein